MDTVYKFFVSLVHSSILKLFIPLNIPTWRPSTQGQINTSAVTHTVMSCFLW